jgi:release factor glutamine methyltransferase
MFKVETEFSFFANMKVSEIILHYRNSLKDLYHEEELSQLIFLVFEHVKDFSKIDLVLRKDELVTENEKKEFDAMLSQLLKNKPVQYVLGYAWFFGMKLKVDENVLIPRQETEELVQWIINDSKGRGDKLKIFDICTGSGCIAVSLKKNLSAAEVTAIDISEKALEVANENATQNQTSVEFFRADILQLGALNFEPRTDFDVMVSNPPYVTEAEKALMQKKELDYEPHLAMFVSDNDPLIFYRRIADMALANLKSQGKLYFEINEKKGNEVVELLVNKGFSEVILKKDLNGKDRMIRATLNVKS